MPVNSHFVCPPIPPQKSDCICCANGNDLPEGEYCRACFRGARLLDYGWGPLIVKKPSKPPCYFVSEYTDGPATRWNVIDRQTQEWIRRFPTEEAAQEHADKLNAGARHDPVR